MPSSEPAATQLNEEEELFTKKTMLDVETMYRTYKNVAKFLSQGTPYATAALGLIVAAVINIEMHKAAVIILSIIIGFMATTIGVNWLRMRIFYLYAEKYKKLKLKLHYEGSTLTQLACYRTMAEADRRNALDDREYIQTRAALLCHLSNQPLFTDVTTSDLETFCSLNENSILNRHIRVTKTPQF